MIIEEFNNILKSNIGSDEKLNMYLNLKSKIEDLAHLINLTNVNIRLNINEKGIQKIFIEERYSDNQLKKNNIELFKTVLLNLLSPHKALQKYTDYYNSESKKEFENSEMKVSKFLNDFLSINDIKSKIEFTQEQKFTFEDEDIENNKKEEIKETDELNTVSIFQPSFEILKEIFKTNLIKEINISFVNNQEVSTRNLFFKAILPQGKGNRDDKRDSHLEPTLKNLLSNIYKTDNQNFNLNLKLDFVLNKRISFQEEIMIKSFLNKNGINVMKNSETYITSVTDFDLLMLLNINKG